MDDTLGRYHTAFLNAVVSGDASDLEGVATTSGADGATVQCYLHPAYDGLQPGGCPTMCVPCVRWSCVRSFF